MARDNLYDSLFFLPTHSSCRAVNRNPRNDTMSVDCQVDPLWRVPPPLAGQDGSFSSLFDDLDFQSIPPPIDESEAVPDYGSCCEVANVHVPPVPHELGHDSTACFSKSVSDVFIAGTDANIPVQPAAPQVSAGPGKRLSLREKNRLKQANYREKLKVRSLTTFQ